MLCILLIQVISFPSLLIQLKSFPVRTIYNQTFLPTVFVVLRVDEISLRPNSVISRFKVVQPLSEPMFNVVVLAGKKFGRTAEMTQKAAIPQSPFGKPMFVAPFLYGVE